MNYFIIIKCKDVCHHLCLCPHCSSYHTVLYGKSGTKQRHLCKSCHKTYTDFTNTPFAYAHFPDKLTAFMECTFKAMTLRDSAKKLKVSYVTLFYWRHKLLGALKRLPESKLKDSVEVENFYMNYSRKGQKHADPKDRIHGKAMSYFNLQPDKVCILTAVDSFKNIYSRAVCKGSMDNKHIQNSIGKLLSSDNVVCSRRKGVYLRLFKKLNVKVSKETLNYGSQVLKYIRELVKWLGRFKGVATKYLNNYISLYKFITIGNFSDMSCGVKTMTAAIAAVNLVGTYKSITDDKLCLSDLIA